MARIFGILITVLFLSVGHTASAQDKLLLQLAEGGLDAFQVTLGLAYENGTSGVEQDYAEALKWYRLAAEQGNVFAQLRLGGSYYSGKGVEQDYAEAVKWYRLAAEQGDARAQYLVGYAYRIGEGVEQDYAEAVKWWRLSAEQENADAQYWNADAQYWLGYFYYKGIGVEQDYNESLKWLEKSAKQGNVLAERELGKSYDKEQDDDEVLMRMLKAAEYPYGNVFAQVNLGRTYYNGEIVEQDYAKAVKWYLLAAQQGYAPAQVLLGEAYHFGQGVIQDLVYSHMWFNIAAALGEISGRKSRDVVAEEMTPEQIAEAQKLARECVRKEYKDC